MNLVVCTCYSGHVYEWYVSRTREVQPELVALEVSYLSEPKLGKMEVLLQQFEVHSGPTLFVDADTVFRRRLVAEDFPEMTEPVAGVQLQHDAYQLIHAGVLEADWPGSINSGVLYFPRPTVELVEAWKASCEAALANGSWKGDEIELLRLLYRERITPHLLPLHFNVPLHFVRGAGGPLIAHDFRKSIYEEAHP